AAAGEGHHRVEPPGGGSPAPRNERLEAVDDERGDPTAGRGIEDDGRRSGPQRSQSGKRSPSWPARNAVVSTESSIVRVTDRAPWPTFCSRRNRMGRSSGGQLVAHCRAAPILRACIGSTRVSE